MAEVLGHALGYVIGRHSAERITNGKLWSNYYTGAEVGANVDELTSTVRQNILMKNGRGNELKSDILGMRSIIEVGYDPDAMTGVIQILKAVIGGWNLPAFESTL